MPSTSKAAAFIGTDHVNGNALKAPANLSPGGSGADASRLPSGGTWGTLGWVRIFYESATGSFTTGQIVTGATSGARARIVQLQGNALMVLERLQTINTTTGVELLARAFKHGETISVDNAATTAVVGLSIIGIPYGLGSEESVFSFSGTPLSSNTQMLGELLSPVLNGVYPDISHNVFFDRRAKRAATLPVASTAWVNPQTVIAASTTVSATVTTNIYTKTTGTWTLIPVVGMRIFVSGFANGANNGVKTVTAATTTQITVAEALATEAAGPSVSIVTLGAHMVRLQNHATTPTATGLLVGTQGAGLALTNVTGTWGGTDPVHFYGGSGVLTTQNAAFVPATAGEWLPYAVRPNLGGVGSKWEVPPSGSDVIFGFGTIGIEPYFIKNALADWGNDAKFFKYDAFGAGIGGAIYGTIVCSASIGAGWVLGDTLTSAGSPGWSAKLVAFDAVNNWLYVKQVVGTLVAGTVTGAGGGSATSTGNVLGWMKGARHWNDFLADIATSFGKLTGDVANAITTVSFNNSTKVISRSSGTWTTTPSVGDKIFIRGASNAANNGYHTVTAATSSTITCANDTFTTEGAGATVTLHFDFDWQSIMVAPWHYDSAVPAFSSSSLGWDFTTAVEGMKQFIADLKDQFGEGIIIPAFTHHTDSNNAAFPSQSSVLRIVYLTVAKDDPQFRPFTADEFEKAVDSDGYVVESATGVYLENLAYPMLGKKVWDTYRIGVIAGAQTDLEEAAVILLTGQSQMAGQTSYLFWQIDNDPELGKIETSLGGIEGFPGGTDTIDENIQIFNPVSGQWEAYSVATNAVTVGGNSGMWGPEVSLLNRLKGRFGKIWCIKSAWGGSSMQASAPGVPSTWAVVARTGATATCTVTTSTSPDRGRFTAASGTPFTVFAAGNAVEVEGAASANNTSGYPTHTSKIVYAVDPGGTWIELLGTHVADASPKSVTITAGPIDLRTVTSRIVREGLQALMVEENKMPRRIGTVTWQGESDLEVHETYKAAAQDHIAYCRSIFGHRVGQELPAPHVWLMLTDKTPLGPNSGEEIGTVRPDVESIRAQQLLLAEEDERVRVVDTKDLPLKNEGRTWPRVEYNDFGVHHTGRATVIAGYLADAALEEFDDIVPPHPSGPAAIEFGIDGGSGGDGGDDVEGDSPGAALLVVEDGTGLEDANSYASIEEADAYFDALQNQDEWILATDSVKAQALRVGTQWLDKTHGDQWVGLRSTSEQALDWPRSMAFDKAGGALDNMVPKRLKDACAEMALRFVTVPEQMDPDIAANESQLTSESTTVGPITVSQAFSGSSSSATQFEAAKKLLRTAGLIDSGSFARR